MYKAYFFFFIVALHLVYWVWLTLTNKKYKFLFVSFYIICIPLQIQYYLKTPEMITKAGALGNELFLPIGLFLFIFLAIFNLKRLILKKVWSFRFNWISVTCLLIFLSFLNSNNDYNTSISIFVLFFLSNILFYYLIYKILSYHEILKGIFLGLVFMTVVHFVLALMFPLLNIEIVTTFFNSEGQETATRYDSRIGAIGTLSHPNSLALFTNITAAFFLSCLLNKFNKRISLLMLVFCAGIIVLTYSRSSYVAFICILGTLFYIHKNAYRTLLSIHNLIVLILPIVLLLAWVILYSPLSNTFLRSDASEQIDNRVIHWVMAFEGFKAAPILGVGINSHLEFFADHYYLISHLAPSEFSLEHQIHNIHLIVLLETGIIGFLAWVIFLGKNGSDAKSDIAAKRNKVLALTQIGLLVAYVVTGFVDWAPFASENLPLFLFLNFFAIKFRGCA